MNFQLKYILLVASVLFFLFILRMVIDKKLHLKYTLTWIVTSICFVILSLFPDILTFVSNVLHIIEPVNALYLLIIFFLIIITFTLTVALSKSSSRVKTLTQEVGLIKSEIEKLKKGEDLN